MTAHRTRVKICCIASVEEALMAISYGASAIGLVGEMPTGPGVITDDQARTIAGAVQSQVETFLLTSRETATDIADHIEYCSPNTVQIVRHVDPSVHEGLKRLCPYVKRVQVIHVEDESVIPLIKDYTPYVDAFLLDSGRPSKAVLGGTGLTHDWAVSAKIVNRTDKPVYLAGGLNPDNVTKAINAVQPYGVDLCSGIRVAGCLVKERLSDFMGQVESVRIASG